MIIDCTEDYKQTFFVSSADWESVVRAPNYDEAASTALEENLNKNKKNLKLSPAIIVVNMTKYVEIFSDDCSKIFSTNMVLSNIGKHDLAKKFKKIIER